MRLCLHFNSSSCTKMCFFVLDAVVLSLYTHTHTHTHAHTHARTHAHLCSIAPVHLVAVVLFRVVWSRYHDTRHTPILPHSKGLMHRMQQTHREKHSSTKHLSNVSQRITIQKMKEKAYYSEGYWTQLSNLNRGVPKWCQCTALCRGPADSVLP